MEKKNSKWNVQKKWEGYQVEGEIKDEKISRSPPKTEPKEAIPSRSLEVHMEIKSIDSQNPVT